MDSVEPNGQNIHMGCSSYRSVNIQRRHPTVYMVTIRPANRPTGTSGRCLKPVHCVSDIKVDNKDVLYEMYSITLNAEFQNVGQAIASMENRFQNLFEHFISCHLLVTACNHDRGPTGRVKCLAAVSYFMYRVTLSLRRR